MTSICRSTLPVAPWQTFRHLFTRDLQLLNSRHSAPSLRQNPCYPVVRQDTAHCTRDEAQVVLACACIRLFREAGTELNANPFLFPQCYFQRRKHQIEFFLNFISVQNTHICCTRVMMLHLCGSGPIILLPFRYLRGGSQTMKSRGEIQCKCS